MAKIRYIETKPIQQSIDFDDEMQWREFIDKRLKEVIDYTFANNVKYNDYFEYHRVRLNKDGTPRKHIDPSKWLRSEKAKKKQKKNWLKYCERRKKETNERAYRRKLAEIDYKIEFYQNERKRLIEEHKDL